MFYILSKSIGYFLTPAGWLLGTLVGAWLLPRYRRRLVGTSLLLFWVLGNSYIVYNQLAPRWEVSPIQPVPRPMPGKPIVAVVLTGGMINTRLPVTPARPLLAHQADRLAQALYLYKTGRVQKILISGGESGLFFYGTGAVQEGRAAMQFLHLAGVPVRDLLWETRSRNTRENALFSGRLLRQHYKTNQCVVVTSAFHMRRALACFARQGITPTPFAGAYMQQPGQLIMADVLVPHEQAFADAMHLLNELAGYVTYAAMGYV